MGSLKIGILGSETDPQIQALVYLLEKKGATPVLVNSEGLNQGKEHMFLDGVFYYQGQSLDDIACWYIRHVGSPLPPAFEIDEQYYLFSDWFVEYMHRRERHSYQLSCFLALSLRNVPIVNPPMYGHFAQLKTYQLAVAESVGFLIPRTLITNSPERVHEFHNQVREVVYKPSMGGGQCRPLDEEALSRLHDLHSYPVIFQEYVPGEAVRVTIVGTEVVSSVRIASDYLDYRVDPKYRQGEQVYSSVELEDSVVEKCRVLMSTCGLLFSGIDLIQRADGAHVFLEANSSPIYLDIERKTQVPITNKLANYLMQLGSQPYLYEQVLQDIKRAQSFVSYALPFAPDQETR